MTVRGVLKKTAIALGILFLLLLIVLGVALRGLIQPDASKFGTVKDEGMAVNRARASFPGAGDGYFVEMDKGILKPPAMSPNGVPQYPQEIIELAKITGLSNEDVREHAIKGQNTWIVWTGGNDFFWDRLSNLTVGAFDLLKLVSSHPAQGYGRWNRWHYLGLTNEPCFTQATKESAAADDFGLWLDQRDTACPPDPFDDEAKYPGVVTGARGKTVKLKNGKEVQIPVGSYYGKPTGILGLRLFPNPAFKGEAAEHWDGERYYNDPSYYQDSKLVRPYRVGMSCAFCHVGPSPIDPPPNPEAPGWQHINSNPGAQYFWVDRIFFWNTRPREHPNRPAPNEHNIIYQLFHTNPPGSLDTSLVSTDYINNPRTMNAVYNLKARLAPTLRWGKESLAGGELDNKQFQDYPQTDAFAEFWNRQSGDIKTARVLKDGSDSVGILGALNRVYLNIGLFSEEWTLHFRPVIGGQKISPIKISDAGKNSAYWGATEDQTADMALFFLATATPDLLAQAPGGDKHLQASGAVVAHGKEVFANNCAVCHSSKIPPAPAGSGVDEGACKDGGNGPQYRECWDRYWAWAQTEEFKAKMREIVLAPDFLHDNFLSSERRVPVDLLQTNACSPLATNALGGDIWDNFSSQTYKDLPPARQLTVHHPVSGGVTALQPLGAGRGYTRPASLVSLWSTAPFLLNNAVGHYDYPYTRDGYYGAGYGGAAAPPYEHGAADSPAASVQAVAYTAPSYGSGDAPARRPGAATGYDHPAGASGATTGTGYGTGYASHCPAPDDRDPYLPCVDNRMRVFNESIREMLYPERRRKDTQTAVPVPGYIYRTTALSCAKVPKGYLPAVVGRYPGFFNWLADWAFDDEGSLTLGPLPAGFPINALLNTKLLPDNDEPGGFGHYWALIKAGPTLVRAFKELGGTCSDDELNDPATQLRAERVVRETGLIDTLVGLSKCPDYVVNRGHYFGTNLQDADKEALIAYLKYF